MSKTFEQLEPVISALDERIKTGLGAFPTDTAEGSIVSFPDGADNIPLKSLVVNIDPVQSGSGDPSPDNVRPISGWTGMTVNANGTEIPISWESEAGTIYGGHLDVTTGVLTVDRANTDMGTLNWTYEKVVPRFVSYSIGDIAKGSQNSSTPGNIVCSKYKTVAMDGSEDTIYGEKGDKSVGISQNANISLKDTAYTNTTDFKTAMNGVQLVYELATPIVYQLTPTEVKSLLGQNNIWGDTGDTTVEYRADTSAYIAKKIAEAISTLS